MHKHAMIIAALALASCTGTVQLPPPQYRMPGELRVHTMRNVSRACIAPGAIACTVGRAPNKVIIMPDPCEYAWDFYGALLCHEQAHALMDWHHPEN